MEGIKVVLVLDGGAPRTLEQWKELRSGLKTQPMSAAIILEARTHEHNTVHLNRASVKDGTGKFRYTLGDFEMSQESKARLLAVLAQEAVRLNIDTTNLNQKQTFVAVFREEMRAVALGLGYSQNVINSLNAGVIGLGPRHEADKEAHQWLAAHSADWFVDEN